MDIYEQKKFAYEKAYEIEEAKIEKIKKDASSPFHHLDGLKIHPEVIPEGYTLDFTKVKLAIKYTLTQMQEDIVYGYNEHNALSQIRTIDDAIYYWSFIARDLGKYFVNDGDVTIFYKENGDKDSDFHFIENIEIVAPDSVEEFNSIDDVEAYLKKTNDKIEEDLKTFEKVLFDNKFKTKQLYGYTQPKNDSSFILHQRFKENYIYASSFYLIYSFIKSNSVIENKFNELVSIDKKSNVLSTYEFNKAKPKLISGKNIIEPDEDMFLMMRFIFGIRQTYKDQLVRIFSYMKKRRIDYILPILTSNGYVKIDFNKKTKISTIIPTNKLDIYFTEFNNKTSNKISKTESEFIKSRTKNEFIAREVEKSLVSNPEELFTVLSNLPKGLFYKGTDIYLLELLNGKYRTQSRYILEYYFTKLIDIKNSMKCTIMMNSKSNDIEVLKAVESLKKLYKVLCYVLDNCKNNVYSVGKNKEYQPISMRNLASSGIYLYDIELKPKLYYGAYEILTQNFSVLQLQTLMDYNTSKFVFACRDICCYMSDNTYFGYHYCSNTKIQFYDERTKQSFIKKIESIKNRIKEDKPYYNPTRTELAKSIAKSIYF